MVQDFAGSQGAGWGKKTFPAMRGRARMGKIKPCRMEVKTTSFGPISSHCHPYYCCDNFLLIFIWVYNWHYFFTYQLLFTTLIVYKKYCKRFFYSKFSIFRNYFHVPIIIAHCISKWTLYKYYKIKYTNKFCIPNFKFKRQ